VFEHLLGHAPIGDLRDRLHPPAAARAQQDIDREDPLHQLHRSPRSRGGAQLSTADDSTRNAAVLARSATTNDASAK
jgi:hypothetical protein